MIGSFSHEFTVGGVFMAAQSSGDGPESTAPESENQSGTPPEAQKPAWEEAILPARKEAIITKEAINVVFRDRDWLNNGCGGDNRHHTDRPFCRGPGFADGQFSKVAELY